MYDVNEIRRYRVGGLSYLNRLCSLNGLYRIIIIVFFVLFCFSEIISCYARFGNIQLRTESDRKEIS